MWSTALNHDPSLASRYYQLLERRSVNILVILLLLITCMHDNDGNWIIQCGNVMAV